MSTFTPFLQCIGMYIAKKVDLSHENGGSQKGMTDWFIRENIDIYGWPLFKGNNQRFNMTIIKIDYFKAMLCIILFTETMSFAKSHYVHNIFSFRGRTSVSKRMVMKNYLD